MQSALGYGGADKRRPRPQVLGRGLLSYEAGVRRGVFALCTNACNLWINPKSQKLPSREGFVGITAWAIFILLGLVLPSSSRRRPPSAHGWVISVLQVPKANQSKMFVRFSNRVVSCHAPNVQLIL